jgi:hypothetical protein
MLTTAARPNLGAPSRYEPVLPDGPAITKSKFYEYIFNEYGQVFAVPLHGAGKFRSVTRLYGDRFVAALRKLDECEARPVAGEAVGEEISLVVVAIEELFIERRFVNGAFAACILKDDDLTTIVARGCTVQDPDR